MAGPTQKSKNLNRSTSYGTYPMTPDKQWINQSENYEIFQDAGASNQSPITVSNSADTLLNIPNGAVRLRIYSSVALRISDEAAGGAGYFVIPAQTWMDWPCSTPTNNPNSSTTGVLYLRGDAASATVQFAFLCV